MGRQNLTGFRTNEWSFGENGTKADEKSENSRNLWNVIVSYWIIRKAY